MIREAIQKAEDKVNNVNKLNPKGKELHRNNNPVVKKD